MLVSTDAASNLDEILGIELRNTPTPVPGAPGLSVLNIDPDTAAESYRQRVLAQMGLGASETELSTVREQLSGACTTEIAAFDEFVGLLASEDHDYDHVIFDTAPTGHTLRLLSLPKAWTGFLKDNDRGASCLGPHSGLKMQEERVSGSAQDTQRGGQLTTDRFSSPGRTRRDHVRRRAPAAELGPGALPNQHLAVNGVFRGDRQVLRLEWPAPMEALGRAGTRRVTSTSLESALPKNPDSVAPVFDMVGLAHLREVLRAGLAPTAHGTADRATVSLPTLPRFHSSGRRFLPQPKRGLIMVMGKGGVGKTTIAAAIAVGLAARGAWVFT